MNLDGRISCNGQILKIRRPKNYHPPEGQVDPQPVHTPSKLLIVFFFFFFFLFFFFFFFNK